MSTLAVGTGLYVPTLPITEHLKPARVEYELAKVEERRAPVTVAVSLLPDGATRDGLLYGWSTNTSDGLLRGRCAWLREVYRPTRLLYMRQRQISHTGGDGCRADA